MKENLINLANTYLHKLCIEILDRSVGSQGNRDATKYFQEELASFGWTIITQHFEAFDWKDKGASLMVRNTKFTVLVSPYSLGCDIKKELVSIENMDELEQKEIEGKIVLMYGEIAKEQLMPKNFIFYNPESHQKIITLLERKNPKALICATGRNAALAGGVYPFPLIEDGDFNIPSVYMTENEGKKLLPYAGEVALLKSKSIRIDGRGYNVIGKKGNSTNGRIVITAHIDAKKDTPGAIDNATGIVILLLVAKLLKDYNGKRQIDIVAFNGEDYYSVPGQMEYIKSINNKFNDIFLNINIDGAGYLKGDSAISFYGLSEYTKSVATNIINGIDGIIIGKQWVQGDHSIFTQQGCPAMAVSSNWFTDNIDSQTITHTPKDNIDIVDVKKLVKISEALCLLIKQL
jgi:aminopeptidase YwaD